MDDQTQTPPSSSISMPQASPSEVPIAPQPTVPAPSVNEPPAQPSVITPTTIQPASSQPAASVSPPPVVTPAPAPASTTEPVAFTPPANAKKILLVEDDEALATVYKTRLSAEGFDIKHVPNGEDALAAAISYRPDLILLDVMMPKVSGFDVLDILRNTPETTNTKVVMLTALSQDADKQRAESLGVDDYLVKSQVVISEVVDRIKKHLNM